MKKVLFIVFIFLMTISFGQDERDKKIVSDLKIGTYDNKNKLIDTLGLYVSSPNRTGLYDLYIEGYNDALENENYISKQLSK